MLMLLLTVLIIIFSPKKALTVNTHNTDQSEIVAADFSDQGRLFTVPFLNVNQFVSI